MTGFNSVKKPVAAALLCLSMVSMNTNAQTSAADIIEQAREQARKIEEFKGVLNDPDQNVRLAAFDVMVTNDDPLIRELALDTGFASTDQMLRGLAFKHAVLGLEQLVLTLEKNKSAPQKVQERTDAYLEKYGQKLVINIDRRKVDLNRGLFAHGSGAGNISGTVMSFKYGNYIGDLRLREDNSLAGQVNFGNGNSQFNATAPIR